MVIIKVLFMIKPNPSTSHFSLENLVDVAAECPNKEEEAPEGPRTLAREAPGQPAGAGASPGAPARAAAWTRTFTEISRRPGLFPPESNVSLSKSNTAGLLGMGMAKTACPVGRGEGSPRGNPGPVSATARGAPLTPSRKLE